MNEFLQAMQAKGIAKQETDKVQQKKKPSKIGKSTVIARRNNAEKQLENIAVANVKSDDILEFFDKLTREEKRELKSRYHGQEKIDLHGYFEKDMLDLLEFDLPDLARRGCKFVELVHGKGSVEKTNEDYPIIKNALNQFLHNRKEVKGFCSTLQPNGLRNTGSVIVMLDNKIRK